MILKMLSLKILILFNFLNYTKENLLPLSFGKQIFYTKI